MRTTRLFTVCGLGLLMSVMAVGCLGRAQNAPPVGSTLANVPPDDVKVIADFQDRVKNYLDLVKQANSGMPKDKPKQDIDSLAHRRSALAASVKGQRANAKQGDLFTPAAAALFRKVIAQTMAGPNGQKIRASLRRSEPVIGGAVQINGSYPSGHGVPLQSTPPSLLENLPTLPKGIEYRVVDHALLLRDTEANTVVDFLPDAFPKG